jgi:hypothetical protein
MKSVTAKFQSSQLVINRSEATQQFTTRRKSRKQKQIPNSIPPPTEELVNYLNQIGKEHPFCVYFKHKTNDPL